MRARFYFIATLFWVGYVMLIVSTPRSANAAEWSVQPSVRVSQEHNDNPRLVIQPHNSVTGSMIAPKLDLAASSNIWQMTGSVEAVQKRFSGESDLDRDDRFYNLGASYATERSTWQLTGSSTKTSIFADELVNRDIGAVQVQKVVDTHSVNPSWTWAVNELTQLQLAYSFNNVSYVDGQNAGLYNYTTRTISAQLSKQLDPKNQVFVVARYSIFNVPTATLQSKSATYQAGITRAFSETMSGTLVAGTRKTSDEQNVLVCTLFFGPFCLQTTNETQFTKRSSSLFNGSLDKKYETTRLKITLSRAFDPSGLGGQVRTDSQEIRLDKQFTPRFTSYFSAGNYQYKSEIGNLPTVDRHLYNFQPGLRWIWTQELTADLSFRYWHIKRAVEDQPTASRSVYLILKYEWPEIAISR